MKTSQVLKKAKSLIDTPEKWFQGEYCDGTGKLCSLGAICVAVDDNVIEKYGNYLSDEEHNYNDDPFERILVYDVKATDCKYVLQRSIQKMTNTRFVAVPEFNDDDTTTHGMVMKLFDAAIHEAEEAEKSEY